jgi:1-phosphofructokinase
MLTVTIEEAVHGAPEMHFHAGGQGFWMARMIKLLGTEVVLCAPCGGESGVVLRTLVESSGVEFKATVSAASNGAYVHDRRSGVRVEVAESPAGRLTRHEMDELYGESLITALDAGTIVLTGSPIAEVIAPQLYSRLVGDLNRAGVRIIADLSGEALAAALSGEIELLKLSHHELLAGGYAESSRREHLVRGMETVHGLGARNVLVSRAADPALALLKGRLLEVSAPPMEAVDHRGTGDSMTAAAAVGLAGGATLEEAVRLGAAAGALNATRHGLATGPRVQIEALAHHVRVSEVDR